VERIGYTDGLERRYLAASSSKQRRICTGGELSRPVEKP